MDWWNTPKAAWGYQLVSLGAAIVLTFLIPRDGILLGIVIVLLGILLLLRAYRLRGRTAPKANRQESNVVVVAKAIMQAKESTPIGVAIPVYVNEATRLNRLHHRELVNALLKLQDDEKVIKLNYFPFWFHKTSILPVGWTRTNNLITSPRNLTYILDKRGFATHMANLDLTSTKEIDISGEHFEIFTLATFDEWFKKSVSTVPSIPDKAGFQKQ